MISRRDIEALVERPAGGGPVLSVYLDVDQSRSANLNRGFETNLRNMLRAVEEQVGDRRQRDELAKDAARVLRFAAGYRPAGRSLAMFCDDSEGLFRSWEVRAALVNDARWRDTPYVRPLLEALDEYERFGVLLADRSQARLFTVFMGEIEEHREAFAQAEVRHLQASGMDHMRSQSHIQRKSQMHALWHLKRVAEMTERLAVSHTFDRLVLAGPVGAAGELQRLLSKRLRSRVIAAIPLAMECTDREVLQATSKIVEDVERREETGVVEDLITAATKGNGAVIGLDETLGVVREGRVSRLVYSDDAAWKGWRCTGCPALFAQEHPACPECGGGGQAVRDLIGRMVERVFDDGGRVEQVRGDAAGRLASAGGIGAFTRF